MLLLKHSSPIRLLLPAFFQPPTIPFKEAEQAGTVEEELAKEKASEPVKLLLAKIPPRKRRQPSARYSY